MLQTKSQTGVYFKLQSGPNEIPTRIIKQFAPENTPHLTPICKPSLFGGEVLSKWRKQTLQWQHKEKYIHGKVCRCSMIIECNRLFVKVGLYHRSSILVYLKISLRLHYSSASSSVRYPVGSVRSKASRPRGQIMCYGRVTCLPVSADFYFCC